MYFQKSCFNPFVCFFCGNNVSPPFEKGVKGRNYNFKYQVAPCQSWQVTQLYRLPFQTGLALAPWKCTIVFLKSRCPSKMAYDMIHNLKLPPQYIKSPFWAIHCFRWQDKRKKWCNLHVYMSALSEMAACQKQRTFIGRCFG